MSEPVDVCSMADLKDGEPRGVAVRDSAVVLVKDGAKVHALGGVCPHRGGPLAAGWVQDGCIVCPWLGWSFELASGRYAGAPGVGITVHRATGDDGRVRVELT